MTIAWPRSREEYLTLARVLHELIGGRQEVVARYHDFEGKDGKRIKGWSPWRGRQVEKDYKPLPGELVHAQINRNTAQMEYRILRPLNPEALVEHLRGQERLGVYVLDPECKVKFLAADFDDHKGALDPIQVWGEVARFVDTCAANGWAVHVERSKSGKGYHVWMFFDAPVAAADVRAIGRWLFEESQLLRDGEDFSTFDRFFPAQSQLPPAGKGFGNLIGLPLCGAKDYAEGKTAWVDRNGQVITEPLMHTRAILEGGRNAAARVAEFMAEWKLEPDTAAGAYDGPKRDPNLKLGTEEEFQAVLGRCKFLPWVANRANWDRVTEPLWFSWVSNAARFEPGDEWIHTSSQGHPYYDALSTDLKIQHARASAGPHKCETIRRNGFTFCPKDGCKLPSGDPCKAPAGLAVWASAPAPRKRNDRSVVVPLKPAPANSSPATDQTPDSHNPPAGSEEGGDPAPWARHGGRFELDPETRMPWPTIHGPWQVTTEGVQDHQNQHIVLRPLWVHACTRTVTDMWGVSIRFYDLDWREKAHAFPRDRLHEQGGVLGRELASLGLPIMPGKEKWVSRFLVVQEEHQLKRIRAATRLGWFDAPESPAVFVLPSQVLGTAREEIVYQPDQTMHMADRLHSAGTLKAWRDQVAGPCTGNPILMFTAMAGLAGPLLKPCQEQSGGFHLYGVTTGGKTTAAQVAASVWGCGADPQEGPDVTSIHKWYATGNALESIAEVHNDSLLVLDEISEVDPMEFGRIIYQIAGGLSKGRANAGGGLRAMRTWRLLFFSTGEKSVRQMLAQAGQDQKGGQRVRLPDIPADSSTDGSRSIVQDPHGRDPKEFVQDLKAACAQHYGWAGPLFVAALVREADALGGMLKLADVLRMEHKELETILSKDERGEPLDLPPEARRVIRRFALVALAGARASLFGLVPWRLEEIVLAIKHVRDRWLAEQGGERSEMDRGLAHLRDQLLTHGDRFRDLAGKGGAAIRELLGWRTSKYYLLTDIALRELCGEYDPKTILKRLAADGFLWHDTGRMTRKSPRIPELGDSRPNLYWISIKFLGEEAAGFTEEDMVANPVSSGEKPSAGGVDGVPL